MATSSLDMLNGQRPAVSGNLDAALGSAFDRGYVGLACQPIRCLNGSGPSSWVELLIRPGVNGSRIPSEAFVDRAAELGMARELDLVVLRCGLEWLRVNPDVDLCSLNVSGQSLSKKRFLHEFMWLLEKSGVEPGRVCIEVTETVPIQDFPSARQFAREVRGAGCKMAMDDFGGGSSNMMMLVPMEMDFLKIDGRFVQPMPVRDDYRNVVRGMVAFAREIGLLTVAECVEGARHFAWAREMNVDYVQGYYNNGEPRVIQESAGRVPEWGRRGFRDLVPGGIDLSFSTGE